MSEKSNAANRNLDSRLQTLRQRIDTLDKQLIQLLNDRAEVVVQIGEIKRDDNVPVYSPERERSVLQQVREWNKGPLPDSCVEAIWRELMSGSFALEKPLRPRPKFERKKVAVPSLKAPTISETI